MLRDFRQNEKTPHTGRFSLSSYMILIAVILLGLSWLMPLHFLPWVSWHGEILSFLAVFFLGWHGLLRSIKINYSAGVLFPVTVLPFLILGIIAGIQGATGQITFWGDVFIFWLYMALCVMCLTLGFSSANCLTDDVDAGDAKNINSPLLWTATVILVGAFASTIVAFAQIFELWEQSALINRMSQLRRPGGNLGQPNHLATLLLMGIVSLLFLYESGKLKALSSGLILLALYIVLAMTESRTGVLSSLLLSLWWLVKRKRVGFKLSPWVFISASCAFLAIFWAWPSIFNFLQIITGAGAEVNLKAGSRLVVWPQLFEAVIQRPWWGWGLRQISEAHNAVAHAYAVSEAFSYSHNILLDLLLGAGVPITALIVLLTAVWLWRRVHFANQLLPWYCLALVLPLAVHSMLEFPFAYSYFLVPVMFVLGILERIAGSKPLLRIGVRPAAAVLLGISIVAAWSVVEYSVIEEDFRIVRFEALRVGKTPIEYRRPDIVFLTQLGALLDGARISPKPDMTAEELELARKVALRYVWTATQNRYALSLALSGNPEEAVRQLRVMRALHGEKTYKEIKANWNALAQDKYPQLRELILP